MYLSQLILNPRSRRVQREVADPYQLHKSILRAFPENLQDNEERVLFRLDNLPRSPALNLLVQSWTLPDWSWLAEPGARGYLQPVGQPNPALKAFELDLATGQRLAFRLRANPTVKRKFDNGDHKRVGLYAQEEQFDWLKRKAEQGGFALITAQTSNQHDIERTIRRQGQSHRLKLLSVQFDGLLQVTDPQRLSHTVRHGIGSAKGFGFGLLSLARP